MPFLPRTLLPFLLTFSAVACAQCPVDTILVRGRVENPAPGSKIRVQLFYSNDQAGPSAETTPDNGDFRLPIEFLTQSSRPLLSNIKPKCDRKPRTVVIKLIGKEQEYAEVVLKFPKDFRQSDPTAYTPQVDVVLRASQ